MLDHIQVGDGRMPVEHDRDKLDWCIIINHQIVELTSILLDIPVKPSGVQALVSLVGLTRSPDPAELIRRWDIVDREAVIWLSDSSAPGNTAHHARWDDINNRNNFIKEQILAHV